MTMLPLVARALLAAPFVKLGYDAAMEPGGRVQLAADLGVPQPELAVRFNGAAMAVGGAALAAGVLPTAAAAGLTASMIPTTWAGHAFWRMEDPAGRKMNQIQFLKNVGLVGGLLAIAAGARASRTG
jgi:putative oxidoreductase